MIIENALYRRAACLRDDSREISVVRKIFGPTHTARLATVIWFTSWEAAMCLNILSRYLSSAVWGCGSWARRQDITAICVLSRGIQISCLSFISFLTSFLLSILFTCLLSLSLFSFHKGAKGFTIDSKKFSKILFWDERDGHFPQIAPEQLRH